MPNPNTNTRQKSSIFPHRCKEVLKGYKLAALSRWPFAAHARGLLGRFSFHVEKINGCVVFF